MTTRHFQSQTLTVGETITLDAATSHHLGTVLRARLGDSCVLFNGDGREVAGIIAGLQKNKVQVELLSDAHPSVESRLSVHLACGIGKGERMDWVVQKATELGVTEVTPLLTDYVNVRVDDARSEKKRQHWEAVAISACEQSGRVQIPTIHAPVKLSDWLVSSSSEFRVMFHPTASKQISDLPTELQKVSLIIGPEGGLSDAEVADAEKSGVMTVQCGPRILRMETAVVVVMTIGQIRWGDLG